MNTATHPLRRPFFWAMAALLAAAPAGAALRAQEQQKEEWQEFRSEEGNFLLWIPAKPAELKVDGCPPGAKVWQASGDSLLTVFQFGFIGRQKSLEGSQVDAFLAGLAQETADSLKGTVVHGRKITISQWPGRETRIQFAAGEIKMCLIDRTFMVRDVKLFVRIVVPEEGSGSPAHRKILDSFKLIDEAKHPRE